MKLPVHIILIIAVSLTFTSLAHAQASAQHVFIVSFDGGKPSVMQQSVMPLLTSMTQEGAGTWQAFTVVPSITLVAHASMLTGVQPDKHLIDWNDWLPEKGLVQVPTIFALAKSKGLITGLIAGKEKFKHLNTPASLDYFAVPGYSAKAVADAAAKFIVAKKPHLTFIHFADADGAGHRYGWGSTQQKKAFAQTDKALKTLRDAITTAGIEQNSVIILSADHGGHQKSHGSTSLEDMLIPWIVWGKGVKPGYQLAHRVGTCDTAATALWLLGLPVPDNFDGKPVSSAFH